MKIFTVSLMSLFICVGAAGCSNLEPQTTGPDKPETAKIPGGKNKSQKTGTGGSPQVKAMLGKLVVADEISSGYDRDLFKHWSDLDGDGCDTRKEVLSRENREPTGASCDAETGMWYSAYDSETTTDPSKFDVDHMVPLAEAWASGADRWDSERREKFANDMHPYSLIAVSASSNREKSDKDPAEWLPQASFVCQYVARWIAVKFRWRLTVDPTEKNALTSTVSGCPSKQLKLTVKVPMTGKTAPVSAPKPAASTKPATGSAGKSGSDPIFSTCKEAKANGYGPYHRSEPEYSHYRDADGDGTVCE